MASSWMDESPQVLRDAMRQMGGYAANSPWPSLSTPTPPDVRVLGAMVQVPEIEARNDKDGVARHAVRQIAEEFARTLVKDQLIALDPRVNAQAGTLDIRAELRVVAPAAAPPAPNSNYGAANWTPWGSPPRRAKPPKPTAASTDRAALEQLFREIVDGQKPAGALQPHQRRALEVMLADEDARAAAPASEEIPLESDRKRARENRAARKAQEEADALKAARAGLVRQIANRPASAQVPTVTAADVLRDLDRFVLDLIPKMLPETSGRFALGLVAQAIKGLSDQLKEAA